jgi:hypothetical protein
VSHAASDDTCPSDPEGCVTVELLLPADYRALSNEKFDGAISALPPKMVKLPPGSNPWTFVRQHFSIAPAASGKISAYGKSLLNRILDLNNISDPKKVMPGTILVPSLPSFTSKVDRSAQNKPVDLIENMVAGSRGLVQASTAKSGGGIHPYRLTVSRKEAATLLHDVELKSFKPVLIDTLTSPASAMEFRLAAGGDGSAASQDFLSDLDRQALAQRLSRQHQTTTLYILDACWPTQAERTLAYEWLKSATAKVNDEIGAGLVAPLEPTGWSEPTNNHCQQIARAIQPLAQLDAPQQRDPAVRIVFAPLTKEQGAEPFLKGLVVLGNLIREYQARGVTWSDLTDAGRKNVIAASRRSAVATLAIIPAAWGPETKVRSSSAVFERLEAIAAFTSTLGDRHDKYFISASWIADVNSLLDVSQQPTSGLIVAAAGNDGTLIDQGTNGRELAYRAYYGPGVIAVANGKSGQDKICCSSYLDGAAFAQANAILFNGSLGSAADNNNNACPADPSCGTSFSTPRAAWLIAATEATRSQVQNIVWAQDVTAAVRAARVTKDCPWKGYLEIENLFRERP